MEKNEYKIISACFELAGKKIEQYKFDEAIPFLKIGFKILAPYLALEELLPFSEELMRFKSKLDSVYLTKQANEINNISRTLAQKVLSNLLKK